MLELITNPLEINRETGFKMPDDILQSLPLDSIHSVAPLLLRSGDGQVYLLIKHIEYGNNLELRIHGARVLYYLPYFTFGNIHRKRNMPKSWVGTIAKYFPDEHYVKVHNDISVERFKLLSESFEVGLEEDVVSWDPVFVYSIDKDRVTSEFFQGNDISIRLKAEELAEQLPGRKEIMEWLRKGEDSRFTLLDGILNQRQLDTLLISSPLNFQEITSIGMYAEDKPEMLAVYRKSDSNIYIISRQEITNKIFQTVSTFDNIKMALSELIDKTCAVGVDGVHLPMGILMSSGLDLKQVEDISQDLRMWLDSRAGEELAYYLIATQTSRYAMDGAIDYCEKGISNGLLISEKDVSKRYRDLILDFERRLDLNLSIRHYFEVAHAGSRMIMCSHATDFLLTDIKTLKIDAGVMIVDTKGRLRGVSDLARAIALTEEARQVYKFIVKHMREEAIPSLRPGMIAEDIYKDFIKSLSSREAEFKNSGAMPANFSLNDLSRDVGHTIGKKEQGSISFALGNKSKLSPGMIGCMEMHWPYEEIIVGFEDTFLITENGCVNITT